MFSFFIFLFKAEVPKETYGKEEKMEASSPFYCQECQNIAASFLKADAKVAFTGHLQNTYKLFEGLR